MPLPTRIPSITSRLALVLLIPALFLGAPLSVWANLEQSDRSTLSADPPSASASWSQDLGTGLSGNLTNVSFPVRFTPGEAYAPNPLLTLYSCETPTYENCGVEMWGRFHSSISPYSNPGIPIDTTLSFDTSGNTEFRPDRYYRIAASFSLLFGGGEFQVYGSATDTYQFGTGTSGGLADIAFSLGGVDRLATTTPTEPTPDPGPEDPPAPIPAPATTSPKVSSVLFLPGIKGSLLYETSGTCASLGTECDRPLWLPLGDHAVPKLYLNPDGTSMNPDVYTREGKLLTHVPGNTFYRSLTERMDDSQRLGTFGDGWSWQPAAYDWRLGTGAIIGSGTRTGERITYTVPSDTPYLIDELMRLASTSPTGKVTIVAHSYGGLVAKSLVLALGAQAPQLVDRLVLVGVPEQGAPRSLAALLFGDREGIPGLRYFPNLILSNEKARTFARHSSASYELLPTASHFASAPAAERGLLSFDMSNRFSIERQSYGEAIDSLEELHAYAAAREGGRMQPNEDDLARPSVLLGSLLGSAQSADLRRQAEIPAGIAVHRIIGSGESTPTGIRLYERVAYVLGVPVGTKPGYEARFSRLGDGAVPTWSAAGDSSGHKYWVDLSAVRDGTKRFIHANLLESPQILSLIEGIVRGEPVLPAGVSASSLVPDNEPRLRLTLYSPATLAVHDTSGRLTGVAPDGLVREEIPGSAYGEFGTHAYVELVPGRRYTATLTGTASGTVSWALGRFGTEPAVRTEMLDLPVTPGSRYTFSFSQADDIGVLGIDTDGNGGAEASVPIANGTTAPYMPPAAVVATTSPDSSETSQSSSGSSKDARRTSAKTLSAAEEHRGEAATTTALAISAETLTNQVPFAEPNVPIQEPGDSSASALDMSMENASETEAFLESAELIEQPYETWWQRLLRRVREFVSAAVALAFP